jgi:hypothetical protein
MKHIRTILTILLLSNIFVLFSFLTLCKKDSFDFAIVRTIYLKSVSLEESWKPFPYTAKFNLYDISYEQMTDDIKENTFCRYVIPYDTIWLFKGMTNDGYKKILFVSRDTTFEESTESAKPF